MESLGGTHFKEYISFFSLMKKLQQILNWNFSLVIADDAGQK